MLKIRLLLGGPKKELNLEKNFKAFPQSLIISDPPIFLKVRKVKFGGFPSFPKPWEI